MSYNDDNVFDLGKYRVRIVQDDNPMGPEGCDTPVYLVHFHRDFENCSKELPFSNVEGLREFLNGPDRDDYDDGEDGDEDFNEAREEWENDRKDWVVFPVSSYIHSGIVLALAGSLADARFPDRRWDV